MLLTRVLPPDEWSRLEATLLKDVWRTLNPQYAEVLVVEQDGEIVGSVALQTVLHAECFETDGRVAVFRALWIALQARVRAAHGSAFWGAAVDEPMRRILMRHAEPIPGDHFVMRCD